MKKFAAFVDTIDNVMVNSQENGVLHLHLEDSELKDSKITISNQKLINFGSCSYLGLELDNRLKLGGINAIKRYGTQFSASRGYLSMPLYKELETNFNRIFDAHTVVAPTTTLAHVGAIPILVDDDDAVILDHQVHNSVQVAVNLLRYRKVHVEMVKHNDLNHLESKIKQLNGKRKIWYMVDGLYSMFGDFAPFKDLEVLMNKYPNFHLYIDDAHGMSVFGKNGRGYTLSQIDLNDQMILVTSLAKGFGTGGGVLVSSQKQSPEFVRRCASTMIMSGPIQPGTLGASLAGTKIHLSPEINLLQKELQDNIAYCNEVIHSLGMPLIANNTAPIFFIGVSLPKIGTKIIQKMIKDGYYLNYGVFPAVPINNTGIRFTITRHHTNKQIREMLERLNYHLINTIAEEDFSITQVLEAFGKSNDKTLQSRKTAFENKKQSQSNMENCLLQSAKSIDELNREEWDKMFKHISSFDAEGMQFLEDVFAKKDDLPENSWDFDYIIIRDQKNNEPILGTFCTTTISKDDMFSSREKSMIIENIRENDPYFLSSKVLMVGSLFTEGNHLYLNKENSNWKEALKILFQKLNSIATKQKIKNIVIRDLPGNDTELDQLFIAHGYVKNQMPNNFVLRNLKFDSTEDFINGLSAKSRRHFRKHIYKTRDMVQVEYNTIPEKELDRVYELYLNVKNKNFGLNTFKLPKELFRKMLIDKNWDVVAIKPKDADKLISVAFSYKTNKLYAPMIIGIDYNYLISHSIYRQALYQLIYRANSLGIQNVNLGFAADIEKKKFGCETLKLYAYTQIQDHFNMEYIESLNKELKTGNSSINIEKRETALIEP